MVLMLCRVSIESAAGISAAAQAKLVYDHWILDIPKLMDIAVLYGRKNQGLTRRLLEQVSLFCICSSICLQLEMLFNRYQQSSARALAFKKPKMRMQATNMRGLSEREPDVARSCID